MNRLKVFLVCSAIYAVFWHLAMAQGVSPRLGISAIPPIPSEPFRPSLAQTATGQLIPVEQFFPATRCAKCHADTYAGWSESLHRNAAREPFYRESADILLRTRGIEFTRMCESCHTPIALFSGALTKASGKTQAPFTPLDHEGLTCTTCHSIVEARLDGTGSFTIRRPALLAQEDGTPIFGDFTDEQILANIPAHKRAVMRPLLKQPEFCATCHKVTAPPDLNGYKQIPGFSAYDEWQQSGASQESLTPFYRRESRLDCRSCHMPKIPSFNDRAAKQELIVSHRWQGANTAAPLFYGQTDQVKLTTDFLKSNHLHVDIFAIKREATGEIIAPLTSDSGLRTSDLIPGEEVTVEVVIANRNVAHSFPPEVRDLYEAWVEFEAIDANGKTVFHSGFIKPDGMLDERSHVYKTIILDAEGRTITRHQIWTTFIKAYDQTIPAGKTDVVRYRFRIPEKSSKSETQDSGSALTLRAKVNYRRVNQEYANYVLTRQKRDLTLPIVRMAETEIQAGSKTTTDKPTSDSAARRWNDYGIALLEQADYGAAGEAFRRAGEADPQDPNLLVNVAIAEMRTERFAPERPQLDKAAALLERAIAIDPTKPRTRFYRALVWRAQNRRSEAAEELTALAREYPRDREVQRQLGQTLFTLGRLVEARVALEAVIAVDPNDAGAYQLLAPIYAGEGRSQDSARAAALYLQFRDDPKAAEVAARFYAVHPEWQDVRNKVHVYGEASSQRPVLTGSAAVPDK